MRDGNALREGDLLEEYYTNLNDAYEAMRQAFQVRGITQDEIAKRLGVDKGLISRRLNGQENLTLKTLSFMASAMMCTLTIDFTPYEMVRADIYEESQNPRDTSGRAHPRMLREPEVLGTDGVVERRAA
jgi:transcriptional regulator with XRE-family HTH domain